MTTDLVRIPEAAKFAGVSVPTIRRRLAAGELGRYRTPVNRKVVLIDRHELEKLMAPRKTEVPAKQAA
jgi:excisionase family DNA binding protein